MDQGMSPPPDALVHELTRSRVSAPAATAVVRRTVVSAGSASGATTKRPAAPPLVRTVTSGQRLRSIAGERSDVVGERGGADDEDVADDEDEDEVAEQDRGEAVEEDEDKAAEEDEDEAAEEEVDEAAEEEVDEAAEEDDADDVDEVEEKVEDRLQ